MKLHLGCGVRNFGPDWYHVDNEIYDHIQWRDVTKIPFRSNTCDIVYASHLFEYFDRQEAVNVLLEWKRVLKPEGILRLAVPDFEQLCNLYKGGLPMDSVIGPLYGKWSHPPIYHKTAYDFESLSKVLESVGFKNVRRYDWRETEHAHIDDHSQAYVPHMDKENGTLISLNVECNK